MIGTPQYMAPEMYAIGTDEEGHQLPDPTEKIDVFSFGLILYEIIFGEPVFSEDLVPAGVMRLVVEGKFPEIPGWIPAFVFQLISECWSVNPTKRPTFSDIQEILRSNDFMINQECDSAVIVSYVENIENEERENAARPRTFLDLPNK
jgi:serine/threonine protein kinase